MYSQLTLRQHQRHPNSCEQPWLQLRASVRGSYLPVVAFLAQLFLEVSQGEAVGLHHAAVGDLLTTEEVGDHELLRPGKAT